MANTKIPVELSSTPGIVDNSNATAITIDSSENLIMTAGGTIRAGGANDLILDAGESGTPDIYLQSGGSTKVKIEGSNGKVGIGNTSPLGKLTISNAAGANAPTTVTAANTYLQLGSDEYGASNNGKFMIGFGYTDATNTNSPAYIGYEETSTSGDTKGELTFYTRDVITDTAPTERMRITDGGNVGIGTTSPAAKLDLDNGSSDCAIRFGSDTGDWIFTNVRDTHALTITDTDGTGEVLRVDSSGNLLVGATGSINNSLLNVNGGINTISGIVGTLVSDSFTFNGQTNPHYGINFNPTGSRPIGISGFPGIAFATSGLERMRIDGSGNVLVGTTSALIGNTKLSVVGEAIAGLQVVTLHNPATSGTRYFMTFGTEASYTERGYIAYNGSSVFVGTVSDIKLKENIRDLDNGLSVISKIKPRVFDWKDGHEKNVVGFISQEIEEIKPNWVSEKDNIKFIESNLTSSIPYLIKAIQEQQAQIDALQSEINLLKGE